MPENINHIHNQIIRVTAHFEAQKSFIKDELTPLYEKKLNTGYLEMAGFGLLFLTNVALALIPAPISITIALVPLVVTVTVGTKLIYLAEDQYDHMDELNKIDSYIKELDDAKKKERTKIEKSEVQKIYDNQNIDSIQEEKFSYLSTNDYQIKFTVNLENKVDYCTIKIPDSQIKIHDEEVKTKKNELLEFYKQNKQQALNNIKDAETQKFKDFCFARNLESFKEFHQKHLTLNDEIIDQYKDYENFKSTEELNNEIIAHQEGFINFNQEVLQ